MTELVMHKAGDLAATLGTMPEHALIELIDDPIRVRDLTVAMRRAGEETIDRQQSYEANSFELHNFGSRYDQALAIEEAFPSALRLEAERRFAEQAVRHTAPEEAVLFLTGSLARRMQSGGGASPDRIEAVAETLADNDDRATIYGVPLIGFSVPELQVAMRQVLRTRTWFPSACEFLEAARDARKFFWQVQHTAYRHREIVRSATAFLASYDNTDNPDTDPRDDDIGF